MKVLRKGGDGYVPGRGTRSLETRWEDTIEVGREEGEKIRMVPINPSSRPQ